MATYLVTTMRLPVQNPGRIPDAVIDNPYHDALTTVVKLEANLMPCSALTFVRRTLVSIRFGQQPWGFVSHYHIFSTMCSILLSQRVTITITENSSFCFKLSDVST
jgi:hypothetical protein